MLWKWDFQNIFFFYFFVCHKLGCFKRKKFDQMQEEGTAHEDESTLAPAEPDSKSEEDKALLKGTEANSNTLPEDSKKELD